MSLVPKLGRELVSSMDHYAREFYELILPPVDITEDEQDLIIRIDLPGFAKNEINISIMEDMLSIKAKRDLKATTTSTYCMHRPTNIDRKIKLPLSPKDYEQKQVIGKATYVDGVVTLKIPLKNRIIVK
jgi:HSP20 family molecular chaperone IbpA